jgi:hypothetical protein
MRDNEGVTSLRRLNDILATNAHAPAEERWVVHPFGVVALLCSLIASLVGGNLVVAGAAAAGAAFLSWDGFRHYRRWSRNGH